MVGGRGGAVGRPGERDITPPTQTFPPPQEPWAQPAIAWTERSVTPEIARAKANAAAAFRASTHELEARFSGARQLFAENVAALDNYQFIFAKGAVPIVAGGHVIGAVGVSGAVPADNDHLIADAAAGHPVIPKSH